MSQKSPAPAGRGAAAAKPPAEQVVRGIRRRTREQHSAEDKIRVVLEGLRGEESIAAARAGARALPARCTTAGPRSSWRLASAASRATRPGPPRPTR